VLLIELGLTQHKSRRRGFQPRNPTRARLKSAPTGFVLCLTNRVGAVYNRETQPARAYKTRLPGSFYVSQIA